MSWEGLVATIRDQYIPGAEDLTVRERLALAWLEKRGRIVTNCNAEYAYESVQKSEPPVEPHADAGVIDFSRHNLWDQAQNGWRGYVATDMMTYMESLMAKGDVVIVDRYAKIMPNLTSAVRNQIHNDLYINGGAAGNTLKIEGLDTAMQHTAGSTAATDKVAYPSSTYRNILCTPGQEGSWSTDLGAGNYPNAALAADWPDGKGDPEWDYWAPKLVKTDSTAFGGGTGVWEDECEYILSETLTWLRLLKNTSGAELVFISDGRMNTQFKSRMRARNYHLMPLPEAVDLGFPQVLNYEGLGIHAEYGITPNTGYIWNFEHTELCSLAPTLLFSKGPEFFMNEMKWLFLVGMYGNLRIKPAFFAKLAAFSTS